MPVLHARRGLLAWPVVYAHALTHSDEYLAQLLYQYGSVSCSSSAVQWLKLMLLSLCFFLSELEEALLVLPFSYVPDLLKLFNEYIQLGSEVEQLCRALLFLLK